MNDERLSILPYKRRGYSGVDIAVYSGQATVGDYCRAIEKYIVRGSFDRRRSQSRSCVGCDICCHERIPLTAIDALKLMGTVAPKDGEPLKPGDFFRRFCYVAVNGRAVDISLGQRYDDSCICLNKADRLCLYYDNRPFVCRTYLCAPASARLNALRESIVNTGEDELVRMWLKADDEGRYIMHEAAKPDINPADWAESAWTGKQDYDGILIRDIVSDALWSELYEPGTQRNQRKGQ